MKRLFIYIFLLAIFPNVASQVFEPETTLGLKFGYNISRVNFASRVNTDSIIPQKIKNGYNGGFVFRYMGEKYAGIQLELLITQKGWDENLKSPGKYSRTLTYLDFPFMAHFEVGGKTSKFQINVGSYFSYLISEENKMEILGPNTVQQYYSSTIDNKMDFGLCGGLGFLQKTPVGHFEIEARFSQGLGNIFKFNHFSKISTSVNQVLSVDLTYLIKL